ncbi:MAG: GAF domain-containing protein, partial [Myxococcota bacterium]
MTTITDEGGPARELGSLAQMLRADARLAEKAVTQPHPMLLAIRDGERYVLLSPAVAWENGHTIFRPYAPLFAELKAALVLIGTPGDSALAEAIQRGLAGTVSERPTLAELFVAVHNAFELVETRGRAEARGKWVNRYRYEIGEFFEIARAITTEREIDKLLALILAKTRFITGADAGSIYVVDGDDPDIERRSLRFKLAQNDSVSFDASEFAIPINERSMAGYAALHRTTLNISDVYRLPPQSPFGFDRSFDEKIGYRTRSVLTTPLLSRQGDVIGVLQLINKKVDPSAKLLEPE